MIIIFNNRPDITLWHLACPFQKIILIYLKYDILLNYYCKYKICIIL